MKQHAATKLKTSLPSLKALTASETGKATMVASLNGERVALIKKQVFANFSSDEAARLEHLQQEMRRVVNGANPLPKVSLVD